MANNRDGVHSRDPARGAQQTDEQHEEVDAEPADRMRLVAMRKRYVQRKAAPRSGNGAAAIPDGGGAPLSRDVRARMEPALGADLSSVRVHTGGESSAAAEELSARAFTTGSDVHFRAGEFAPGTREGDRLLAHELTHVVQGQKSGVQRKAEHEGDGGAEAGAAVSHPDEPAEKEADAVGDQVADQLHADSDGDQAEGAGQPDGAAAEGEGAAAKGEGAAAKGDGAAAKGEGAAAKGEGAAAKGAAAGGKKISRNRASSAGAPPIAASQPAVGAKIFRKWTEFKDLPADAKKPTTDPNHPHLKEMGITNLGPYKYFPAKGEFQYSPPSDLQALWSDTEATKSYDPEAPAAPQAQAKPADKAARIAKAKQKFGPGLDAILTHDDGKTPRPFQTVQDEDARGAGQDAHNVQRHCLSGASDMKSKQDVALRAAFGMIGGVVRGVYTPVASAFDSPDAANAAIAGPLNTQMKGQWLDWRLQLAAGKNPFSPVTGAGGGGAVIYKSASGAQLPVTDVPIYLGLDPSHKGVSPLWAGDARWQKWWDGNPPERKDYEKKNGPNAIPPPLTTDASAGATGISMRVLADPTPTNGGWILHAAWPI